VKRILLLFVVTITTAMIYAIPDFNASKNYQIVCSLYTSGCIVQGSSAGQQTPLYYYANTSNTESTYWIFTEVKSGEYSIRNKATKQYVTYDGERTTDKRYIEMTDKLMGDSSLWKISLQGNGYYTIRNVYQSDNIWDVRSSSYIVGTYANSSAGNANQVFAFYDANGNQVTEESNVIPTPTATSFDVSSWLDGTTNSLDNWTFTGFFLNTGAGGSHINGDASLDAPFIEYWRSNTPLSDSYIIQTVSHIPNGKYTLTASMISCWQYDNDQTIATGVNLFLNDQVTPIATKNNTPLNFSITSLISTGTTDLGVKINSTNTNWVGIDNVILTFHGTSSQLITGEEEKVKFEAVGIYTTATINEKISAIKSANPDTTVMFTALETLRKSFANIPKAKPFDGIIDSILLGIHGPVYDQRGKIYIYSLPSQNMDSNYTCPITYKKVAGASALYINNVEVDSGSTYTFNNVTANAIYTLKAIDAEGTTITTNITFTTLPIVQIYGTFGNEYTAGTIRVYQPTKKEPNLYHANLKWRGGITNGSDKHKRNYDVKLKDETGAKMDQKFFELRNDNKWILDACQVDMSRVRNRTLTDLWNDYGHKPYYFDKEPKALTGTRGQFVETLLNDQYVGVYCMTEAVDRKQMKLADYDSTANAIHGLLWKSKEWSYSVFMGHNRGQSDYSMATPIMYDNSSETWDSYEVNYPDIDDVNPTDFSPLYNAVNLICSGSDADVTKQFCNYFDYPVLMDYYIFLETILSTDNHGKNMFFAVYDKAIDKKITFGVWDLDATTGQRWSDAYYHNSIMQPEQDYTTYITNYENGDYNLFRRLKNLNINNFNDSVRYRYRKLRHTYLATDSIIARFTANINKLKASGAAAREGARWNGDSDISGLTLDFDTELTYLKDWITRRMNYLDNTRFKISELPPEPVDGIATVNSSNHMIVNAYGSSIIITSSCPCQIQITNTAGITVRNVSLITGVNTIDNLPSGVYIVNNKKVIIGR
jgi:spore coat protein H